MHGFNGFVFDTDFRQKDTKEVTVEMAAKLLKTYLLEAFDSEDIEKMQGIIKKHLEDSHAQLKHSILKAVFDVSIKHSLEGEFGERVGKEKALASLPGFFADITDEVDRLTGDMANAYSEAMVEASEKVNHHWAEALSDGLSEVFVGDNEVAEALYPGWRENSAEAQVAMSDEANGDELLRARLNIFKEFAPKFVEKMNHSQATHATCAELPAEPDTVFTLIENEKESD